MSRKRADAFILLAGEELGAAGRLVEALPRQATYFLSQAAEKLARAVLAVERTAVGPTHQIGRIASALPESHRFRTRLIEFDWLSSASTRYRYPGAADQVAPPPAKEKLKQNLSELTQLRDDIAAWLMSFHD